MKNIIKELMTILLFALILYLFYRRLWAFILLPPAAALYHIYHRRQIRQEQARSLSFEFKDALISIAGSLRAGYSFENAISEASSEMLTLYGPKSRILRELNQISAEIRLGVNTEKALLRFKDRCKEVKDIDIFVSVYRIAAKSGGNLIDIIKTTSDDIAARIDTRNEISVLISSKKLEQTIMSFMPMGIILYISIASPDILAPLYGNITGAVIMTVCLCIYTAAYFISVKIMDIRV